MKSPWNWAFSTKLIFLIFVLIVTSVTASTLSLIQLYKKDKLATVFLLETMNISQVAGHLENLISLAKVIDVEKAKASKDIIFILDDACNPSQSKKGVISDFFKQHFEDLEINPTVWTESLELFKICSVINVKTITPTTSTESQVFVVPSKVQMTQPYIVTLLREGANQRIAVLSMDGFNTTESNTLLMTDTEGNKLWSTDSQDYIDKALADTGLKPENIRQFSQLAIEKGTPGVQRVGTDGLLSSVKVGEDWAMLSLAYEPTTLKTVYFATSQSILLAMGFSFLCLVIGRRSAVFITKPLNELRIHAERVGRGDFENPIEVLGDDEISVVKMAFNSMTEKIKQLIHATKAAVELKQEMELAEKIQQMLIPPISIKQNNFNIASFLKSANHCGGDWWGCVELKREDSLPLLVVMIGDVTGHGTASALVTATIRGGLLILENFLKSQFSNNQYPDPRKINEYFNSVVFQAAKGSIGMTFFTAIIDFDKNTMVCSNAGHNFPYLLVPGESITKMDIKSVGRSSIPLGYEVDTKYDELDTYPYPPGSRLIMYTDGLIECMKNGINLYDRKQLRKGIMTHGKLNADNILKQILADRSKLIGNLPPEDDVTVVILESTPGVRASA